MAVTVAVLNQKGGVGKTTVTLGLASAAQAHRQRVLVVDLDPQASATWALGVEPSEVEVSTADVLQANAWGAAAKAIVPSGWGEGVDVLPANLALTDREADVNRKEPELRLRKALDGVTDGYDAVLIDCAPSLGLNTRNGLTAADLAVLVVEPAALSLRGVRAVLDVVDDVWDGLNPDLDIAGVVVNRVPPVSSEADRRLEELGALVGKRSVWQPYVRQRTVVAEALGAQTPIHRYGYRAADSAATFDALWAKVRRAAKKHTG